MVTDPKDFPVAGTTVQCAYREIKKKLAAKKIENAEIEARRIIVARTPYDLTSLVTSGDATVTDREYESMMEDVARRLSGTPLSRIYQYNEFWGLPFELSGATLDPRPDTEILVERALDAFTENPPKTILDLGTGTGCILISLLHEWKGAKGIGVDVSQEALQVAKRNARRNHLESRSRFICGSWLESIGKKFDLIVSNPPYIANQVIPTLSPEVKNHDPILALDGGKNGLQAYSAIFSSLKSHLNEGGKALFEIGFDQRFEVVRLAEDSGLCVCGIFPDLAGQPRVVEICCGDK